MSSRPSAPLLALALVLPGCAADEPGEPVDPLTTIAGCESEAMWSAEGAHFEARVIELVNDARRVGGRCGDRVYRPQGPLTVSPRLHCAARRFSVDMMSADFVGPIDPEDRDMGDRLDDVGYDYAVWAAGVGAGWTSADHAVDAWLENPAHCWKLFAREIEEIGVGVLVVPEDEVASTTGGETEGEGVSHPTYWTLAVGTPAR
ncbi:MAG: hypothetical protein H6711_10795 [Myxococcales bacterium]|nr:hypothetical protein [Myxococcales bacterium]